MTEGHEHDQEHEGDDPITEWATTAARLFNGMVVLHDTEGNEILACDSCLSQVLEKAVNDTLDRGVLVEKDDEVARLVVEDEVSD